LSGSARGIAPTCLTAEGVSSGSYPYVKPLQLPDHLPARGDSWL
jgi:hypothetical protein